MDQAVIDIQQQPIIGLPPVDQSVFDIQPQPTIGLPPVLDNQQQAILYPQLPPVDQAQVYVRPELLIRAPSPDALRKRKARATAKAVKRTLEVRNAALQSENLQLKYQVAALKNVIRTLLY